MNQIQPAIHSPDRLASLRERIDACLLADRPRLLRELERIARRARAGKPHDRLLSRLEARLAEAEARRERRLATPLKLAYPESLPVSARRDDILAALREHQVVIVCGETGSGKTTQLPKFLLEAGHGRLGMIGHTQPRRIAARTLALRIAEELEVAYGREVGCKVRFGDHVSDRTRVKVMTDGILLAEIRQDPELLAYDALLIDEAHERSLNIDFLLGYLKRLLPRRPDLKLVITSATIDTERFSKHFGGAPVIDVSGRTWPVEIRYRPLRSEDPDALDRDLEQGVLDAVDELAAEGPGDVLVFLPGEREIRETAELLRKHHPPGTEILPLFGRLSLDRQRKVFAPHRGRRIVLATNVAETSLTVPGIRYVVDSGLVRLARYSPRSKVQRLPVEPVSRASADQRAGRCGRLGPGVCIRLYSEADYESRPAFTDPEIRRANLAGVILQMADRHLGQVEDFPFLDPPDPRQVKDGYRTLVEIGALDADHRLTETGRRLARLPLDVRIGRMLLAAEREGCLEEVAVIASALSVQDPREYSPEHPEKAREKHALFADERSDFIGWLKLWAAWREQSRHLSGSKLRKWCQAHWLSWMRMREWQDIHRQIRELLADMGLAFNRVPAEYDAIHRALIAGLPGHVARHEESTEYRGARDLRLHLFPGTGIKGRPKWILAAEIVETSRRFARTLAAIRPEWVEQAVPHLLKRTRTEPHWDRQRGRVVARETVSLYGLVLASGRRVDYGRIDPQAAREIFLHEALAGCELRRDWPFQKHNRALIEQVREEEVRQRRPNLLVPVGQLAARFATLLPERIHSERDFNRWYGRLSEAERKQWFLRPEDVRLEPDRPAGQGFPDVLALGGLELPLRYHLAPGEADDGVTVMVPLPVLPQLSPEPFEWLVPGLMGEKVTALIRSLPKGLRRHFVPAPDFARAVLEAVPYREGDLLEVIADALERMTGVRVPGDAWQPDRLAPHLRMRFSVRDGEGREIAAGRDLRELQARLANRAVASFRTSAGKSDFPERESVTAWDFGTLPEKVAQEVAGVRLHAWPALVREGDRVALRLLPDADTAARRHRDGVIALFMIVERRRFRTLSRQLPGFDRMALALAPTLAADRLREDLLWRIAEEALGEALESSIRTRETFEAAVADAAPRLMETANRICTPLLEAAERWHRVHGRLNGRIPPAWLSALGDMRGQLDLLVYPEFLRELPTERLLALPRYLRALEMRQERLEQDPVRDRQRQQQVDPWWADCLARLEARDRAWFQRWPCRWLVEEYRVSLFAQSLGTHDKVSPERLRKACGGNTGK